MEQILPVSIQKVERYNVFHVERAEGLNTIDTKIEIE